MSGIRVFETIEQAAREGFRVLEQRADSTLVVKAMTTESGQRCNGLAVVDAKAALRVKQPSGSFRL
jgi:hypothetical protein